jgi:predicted phosphoribosyltransferase
MQQSNEQSPIQAELVSTLPRRRIPIALTIVLSLAFGAVLTLIDLPEIKQPVHPIVVLGLVAEGCSHAVAAALLLEGINWTWSRVGR